MRIEVNEIGRTFGRQTRAYAEYRMFSSLAPFSHVVREADVSLTQAARGPSVVCSVTVDVESGAPVRVVARGRHAYDAINRAAARVPITLRRHADVAVPRDEEPENDAIRALGDTVR